MIDARSRVSFVQHAIEQAIRKQVPREMILRMVHRLRLEAVEARLTHLADQARALAERLGKEVYVRVEDNGVRVDSDKFVVELEDDGAGIDWDAVRGKALALGLPANSQEDLDQALLAEGVTTAREVTEVSGRGVGFGAAFAVARELGATCRITSVRGQGTRIRIEFDEDQTAPELAALLRTSVSPRSHPGELGTKPVH